MMSKRTGDWSWALSGEERLAAAAVRLARIEGTRVSRKLQRTYAAMLEKQRKLLNRVLADDETSATARDPFAAMLERQGRLLGAERDRHPRAPRRAKGH